MAGNQLGALKAKLGLRGETKPGEMISRMNAIKYKTEGSMIKCKTCGSMYKIGSTHTHKMKYKTSGIKKTGTSFGKSNKLGSGGRFRQVEHAVAGKKGVYNPAGLAAYIGRKSLGKKKFQNLAAKARSKK